MRHEGGAGHNRHLLLHRGLAEGRHINAVRQGAPDEQPALRAVVGDEIAELAVDQITHQVELFAVNITDFLNMGLHIVMCHPFIHDQLAEHRGVHICRLLADRHLGDQRRGGNRVAHAHTGREDFGEGARIDDNALLVKALDRGHMLARDAQVAIRVIFNDQHAVLFCELVDPAALGKRHGNARRILKIRDRIDKPDILFLLERSLQLVYIHAVCLHGDAAQLRVVGAETVERADEGGRFADHGIALVAQRLGGEIHHLLCAGCNQ